MRQAEELLCQGRHGFEAWEACRDPSPGGCPEGLTWPGGGLPDQDVVKELHLSQEQDRILTRAVESATGKVLKS